MKNSLYTLSKTEHLRNIISTLFVMSIFMFGCFWMSLVWQEIRRVKQITEMHEVEFQGRMMVQFPEKASQNQFIAITERALNIVPLDMVVAKRAAVASVQFNKPCVLCETRLAYIDILENGKLTVVGQAALRHSYDISPYGSVDTMKWRLNVSSVYWDGISGDLQTYALMQITALGETSEGRRWLGAFNTNVSEIRVQIARYNNNG